MSKEKKAIEYLETILNAQWLTNSSREYMRLAIKALKRQIPSYGYSIPVHEDPLVPAGQVYLVCDGKIVGAITNISGASDA